MLLNGKKEYKQTNIEIEISTLNILKKLKIKHGCSYKNLINLLLKERLKNVED